MKWGRSKQREKRKWEGKRETLDDATADAYNAIDADDDDDDERKGEKLFIRIIIMCAQISHKQTT